MNLDITLSRNRIISATLVFASTLLWLLGDNDFKAVWPSVVAILLVVITRQVLLSLVLAAFSGALLLSSGNPVQAFSDFWTIHIVRNLQSDWKIGPIIFTLMLGGFAALIERGGGFQALVNRLVKDGKTSALNVQWSAYVLGLICFFDGLASSMTVGRVFRQLADKFGVPRALLAYIVDSTSSAVTCVAIISTWIAFQLSQIKEGFRLSGVEEVNVFGLFLRSIPYNFYCLYTIGFLALVILWNVRIGPMRHERGELTSEPTKLQDNNNSAGAVWRSLVPLLVLIFTILIGLYVNHAGWRMPKSLEDIATAYGNADAALVLVYASAFASLVAFALYPRKQTTESASRVFETGAVSLFGPVMILVAAWALSSVLGELGAADVLTGALKGSLPVFLLPVVIFGTGAVISFTTGTSWGTMGILMPLAVPVVLGLSGEMGYTGHAENPYLLAAIGAVFSGAVFGDHCSPLSDTTIVSAISCEVDPYVHVKTQLPYALVCTVVSIVCGFLLVGSALPVGVILLIGAFILVLIGRWKRVNECS